MKKFLKTISAVALLLILVSACADSSGSAEKESGAETPPPVSMEQLPSRMESYYIENLVEGGIQNPAEYEIDGVIRGGMVTHHQLASDMMAGFFKLVSENKEQYDTVLIVSPSHFPDNCSSDVVTSSADWTTPYGGADTNSEIVDKILKNTVIKAEDNARAVSLDHGVSSIVPFVRYYLPDADIAVALLGTTLSTERLEEFHRLVAEISKNERVLLVVSVDCSHYLLPDEADEKDSETEKAIESFDFDTIMKFTDDNIDSPQALSTLLFAAEQNGWKLTQLDHSASQFKLPHAISNPIYKEGITTYFIYGATQ